MTLKTRSNPATKLLRRALLGWLVAVTAEYALLSPQIRMLDTFEGLAQMSLPRVLALTAAATGLLCIVGHFLRTSRWERYLLPVTAAVLSTLALCVSFSWAFFGACCLVILLTSIYAVYGWNSRTIAESRSRREKPLFLWLTVAVSILFFLFVSIWTVCRVRSFSSPTFDFGIFAQMFHSMRTTGLAITTVERDGALSHFMVHMSPIYYLMLPFYCIAPYPETLQVLQAAVITSAVIPLWMLSKIHGLKPAARFLCCTLLLLLPAFSGGTGYDIHENCFLTPLILWLFYCIDRRNAPLTALFALLTCLVKEDAPVYVAVIGLWCFLKGLLHRDRKDIMSGAGLLAGAVLYFAAVTSHLAKVGDGVMTYRYSNFIYDSSRSLTTVIKAVLLNPMKAVYECVDPEKLYYIAMTMLPLLGLPFLTRRYERYILLIPYILINLMSDYQYQHDIFFQYSFGSTACLIYLCAVNLADLKEKRLRLVALITAVAVSALCFCTTTLPKGLTYPRYCLTWGQHYDNLRQTLSLIPEDATVSATTFYTSYLSLRDTLYDVRYSSREHILSTEYIAVDIHATDSFKAYSGYNGFVKLLQQNGYTVFAELEDTMVIFQKTD